MVSDLVERLRARAFRLATRDFNGDGATLAKEAADEIERRDAQIERLRAERDAARAIADKLAEALRTVAVTSSREIVLEVARAALAEYDAAREPKP